MKSLKKLACLVLAVLMLGLAGCSGGGETSATAMPEKRSQRKQLESLTAPLTKEEFSLLEDCKNLKYLDVTGSTCYDSILFYVSTHPEVQVIYTVDLGGTAVKNTETAVSLAPGSYTPEALEQNLRYLPTLTALELKDTTMTMQQLESLKLRYPRLTLSYDIALLGGAYAPDTTELNLSLSDEDVPELLEKLVLLPKVEKLTLSGSITPVGVKQVMDAAPEVQIDYSFDFFGQTLSTATESAVYKDVTMGDGAEEKIRAALDIMPNCTSLTLENCGLSNDTLASIRDDYPGTDIIWRITFGNYSYMTDTEMIRAVYNVYDSHVPLLKYFTKVKYIDMGHNDQLTDLSFVAYMPELEIFIGSGAPVKTLKGFENCKKLEWLELAYCYSLTDIDALAQCDSLRFLNISFSKVSSLAPIENLKLERFLYLSPNVPNDEVTAYQESHPDCWSRFTGQNPYSLGWRYEDIGETFSPYYLKVREVFHLDEVDQRLNAQKRAEEAAAAAAEEAASAESGSSETPAPAPTPDPAPDGNT